VVEAVLILVVLLAQVEMVVAAQVVQRELMVPQEAPILEVAVEVQAVQETRQAALAALALSSSRSTNKDLWKLKSTDFSA
jgi:hypothetical protein